MTQKKPQLCGLWWIIQFTSVENPTHTKGSETEEAWEVIVLEHGEDMACYQLLADIGGIHADNIDAMVQDLDAAHAEAKAFLIRYKQEHFAVNDIFGQFSL